MMKLALLFSLLSTFALCTLPNGKYHINSQWGDICADPATGRLVVCKPDQPSTVWEYYCAGNGAACLLKTATGYLQVDLVDPGVMGTRRIYVVKEGRPAPIKFTDSVMTDEGLKTHVHLGYDQDNGINLYLDSDRYATKLVSAAKKADFPQQHFIFKPLVPFTPHMVAPGKYYIRSQWGLVCVEKNGIFANCNKYGLEPQEWEVVEADGEIFLKNGLAGWVGSFMKDGHLKARLLSLEERTPIKIEPGSGPLNGDKAFKIRFAEGYYLDSDRSDPTYMQAWKAAPYSQQDFVFVPARKLGGRKTEFQELIVNSYDFEQNVAKFPIKRNTMETLSKEVEAEEFARDAEKAEIFMDATTYELITKFFAYKKANGNAVEKAVYVQIKDTDAFIDRLIQKRPLTFFTSFDTTLCRGLGNNPEAMGADWALVGQVDANGNSKEGKLKMQDYMTYEEMELAALVNVCTATRFINDGARYNNGKHTFHPPIPGFLLAGIGPRFEIPGRMEFRHMAVLNVPPIPMELPTDPVSRMWQDFYGMTEAPPEDYFAKGMNKALNIITYKTRLHKTLLPIIKHADKLGEQHGKMAVLRLVGFGLGAWAVFGVDQEKHFHDVVFEILKSNDLPHTARIEAIWMGRDGENHKINGTQVKFCKNNPSQPIGPGELLVATYAWDGNSFPGNEYWIGSLSASGDPAAAACSTIQEMQNPLINKCLTATNNLALYA